MTIWNGTLSLSILFSTTKNYFYFIFGVGISFVNSFWNVHASASGKQQHRTGPGKSNIASHRDGCSSTFSFCSFASDTSLMEGRMDGTDGRTAGQHDGDGGPRRIYYISYQGRDRNLELGSGTKQIKHGGFTSHLITSLHIILSYHWARWA